MTNLYDPWLFRLLIFKNIRTLIWLLQIFSFFRIFGRIKELSDRKFDHNIQLNHQSLILSWPLPWSPNCFGHDHSGRIIHKSHDRFRPVIRNFSSFKKPNRLNEYWVLLQNIQFWPIIDSFVFSSKNPSNYTIIYIFVFY